MKKTKLFKSLLVAAGLCMGASAGAQTTTLMEYGTSDVAWSTTNLAEWTAGGTPTISDDGTYVGITGGNGSYATSKTIAPTANSIINVSAVWRGRSNTGRTFAQGNGSYFRFGNIVVAQNDQTQKHGYGFTGLDNISSVTTFSAGSYRVDIASCTWLKIDMEINTASNTLTSFTIKSEDGATTYASASNVALSDADYNTVAFGYRKSGSVSTANAEQLKSVKITQTVQTVTTADYTVKYVCGETEVKEAATRTGVVGQDIVLNASDIENFYANDKKYIFVSSDVEGKTVADGAVVTVTFREAEKYAWTAKSSVGAYTISGETWEGDKATAKYPLYVLVEGMLWQKDAIDKVFAQSFDVTENNQEFTLEYTETETEAIYYSEAEDVDGMTVYADGNAAARSSQRAVGYAKDADVVFTTLAAGKYKIVGAIYSPTSAGAHLYIKTGNRVIVDKTTGNANSTAFDGEFVVAQESNPIAFAKGGGNTAAFDYVYIQQLEDPTEEELAEAAAADEKADKAARVFSIVGENVTGGWDNDYALTQSTKEGEEDIYTLTLNDFEAWPGTTYEYKLRQNNNWDGYQLPASGEGNKSFTVDKGGVYKLIFTADVANNTIDVQTILTKSYTYTASFTNTYNWGAVYAYVWSGEGESKIEQLGAWPGTQLTADANGLYTATILNKVAPEYIIFNANDGNQTGDLAFVDGSIYNYDGDKSVSINVTAAGYATYCSTLALDFTSVEGVTAYRAVLDGSSVSFEKVEKVPAGEGILVKASSGKYTVPSIAEAEAIENAFVGVTEPKTIAAGAFVLMNGQSGVGFYKTANEFTLGANTAYLPALPTEARFIGFDNTTTAIEGVATVKESNGEIYNLQGQRVSAAKKGLYIINGKKMLVK